MRSHRFRLTLPASPDDFLDDPRVHAAHQRNGFMPYWPYLWPSARRMAEAVAAVPWPAGMPALEIGCGIGLVGLALLAGGLCVTFSDYDPTAVSVAVRNARQNGFDAEGWCFDWRQPPSSGDGLQPPLPDSDCKDAVSGRSRLPDKAARLQFPFIFGCDVLYEPSEHAAILNLLHAMLAPRGMCWLGDPGRRAAGRFMELARQRGFGVDRRDKRGARLTGKQPRRFQVIVLRR